MKCCTQCFKAKEVVEFIERAGASGDCDCCGAEGVKTMPAEDLGGLFDPLLSLYEPAKEQTFHIDESLADAVGSWEVFDDELPKKTQNQILDEIRFGPLDSNERSITRSSDEMWQFKFANQDEEIWEQFVLRGVRHKLLTFNRIKHAFESGESTNWSRVLTHWVSRSCRNVIAKSC